MREILVNKKKKIGQVVYVVEGDRKEFTLLNHIFVNLLGYNLIEAKTEENVRYTYKSSYDKNSVVCIVKSETSNIKSIAPFSNYLDCIYERLSNDFDIDVENAAIYYLFDRDRQSNQDPGLILNLLHFYSNSRDNESYDVGNGLLLLSYPALESYIVSCFEEFDKQKYDYSVELKEYVGLQNYQQNKITLCEIINACSNFLCTVDNLYDISITNEDMDAFEDINKKIFGLQEKGFKTEGFHRILSLLSVSFIDLGILVLV